MSMSDGLGVDIHTEAKWSEQLNEILIAPDCL